MNRWTLVALLVGLGLGYLVAGATRQPEPRRAERAAVPEVRNHEPTRSRRTRRHATPRAAPTVVVTPTAELDEDEREEGDGQILVDFSGLPDAEPSVRVEGTDLEGRYEYEQYGSDVGEDFVEFEWRPGVFRVTWLDAGGLHLCGARVRVEEHRITRIDAADPRHRLPDPAGLAVLTVRVPATAAGWHARALVSLHGDTFSGRESLDQSTNADGFARFRAMPGEHVVALGDLERKVTLRAGTPVEMELAHDEHGDVVIEPSCPGRYELSRDRSNGVVWSRRTRFLYLEPGTYSLVYRFVDIDAYDTVPMLHMTGTVEPSPVTLQTVNVIAGRTIRIRHERRPGTLVVRVDAKDGDGWQARLGDRIAPLRRTGDALEARFEGVAVGGYKVEILGGDVVRGRRNAVVGHGSTTHVDIEIKN